MSVSGQKGPGPQPMEGREDLGGLESGRETDTTALASALAHVRSRAGSVKAQLRWRAASEAKAIVDAGDEGGENESSRDLSATRALAELEMELPAKTLIAEHEAVQQRESELVAARAALKLGQNRSFISQSTTSGHLGDAARHVTVCRDAVDELRKAGDGRGDELGRSLGEFEEANLGRIALEKIREAWRGGEAGRPEEALHAVEVLGGEYATNVAEELANHILEGPIKASICCDEDGSRSLGQKLSHAALLCEQAIEAKMGDGGHQIDSYHPNLRSALSCKLGERLLQEVDAQLIEPRRKLSFSPALAAELGEIAQEGGPAEALEKATGATGVREAAKRALYEVAWKRRQERIGQATRAGARVGVCAEGLEAVLGDLKRLFERCALDAAECSESGPAQSSLDGLLSQAACAARAGIVAALIEHEGSSSSGRSAFRGAHLSAELARVILEAAPSSSEARAAMRRALRAGREGAMRAGEEAGIRAGTRMEMTSVDTRKEAEARAANAKAALEEAIAMADEEAGRAMAREVAVKALDKASECAITALLRVDDVSAQQAEAVSAGVAAFCDARRFEHPALRDALARSRELERLREAGILFDQPLREITSRCERGELRQRGLAKEEVASIVKCVFLDSELRRDCINRILSPIGSASS